MTPYFYTDPLAAAWMRKHHELRLGLLEPAYVKIDSIGGEEAHMIGGDYFIDMLYLDLLRWEMEDNADWKFYVHPDSLHFLEPKDGIIWKSKTRGIDQAATSPRSVTSIAIPLGFPKTTVIKVGASASSSATASPSSGRRWKHERPAHSFFGSHDPRSAQRREKANKANH